MKAKLKDALKDAMKARAQVRVETIRALLSEIQYDEIQKKVDDLPEADCLVILKRELNRRKEEAEFAEKAQRADHSARLVEEMSVINAFLPRQLDEGELEEIIGKLKAEQPELNVAGAMKHLKDRFSGSFDGKAASTVAKRLLGA
jgi:uncharacterized protein